MTKTGSKYAFIGQYNENKKPSGFARVISQNGTVGEGTFKDGQRHGCHIIFLGDLDSIYFGWFVKGVRQGNYLELNAKDLSSKSAGWYRNDEH